MARPGFKPIKQDSHVKRWKAFCRQEQDRKRQESKSAFNEEWKRNRRRERQRTYTKEIKDCYVVRRLKKNCHALKGVNIPQSLIDLERVRLQIVREIKDKRTSK